MRLPRPSLRGSPTAPRTALLAHALVQAMLLGASAVPVSAQEADRAASAGVTVVQGANPPAGTVETGAQASQSVAAQGAQSAAEEGAPGSELTVYLATVGPGAQVWELFGHNAIWIDDARRGTVTSYNYGIFDYAQADFIPRLLRGRMLYRMMPRDAHRELAEYTYRGRTVWLQRLNMPAPQKAALHEFLEWNALPENQLYAYDYFRDNCSTRVRDALDRALGGLLKRELAPDMTEHTYRSHSLRQTAHRASVYTGLLLAMGAAVDRPLTRWEDTFIPMQLQAHLRDLTVVDESGATVPLVASEQVAAAGQVPAPPARAPRRIPGYLLAGVAVAGLMLLAARARNGAARYALAFGVFLWELALGFFGLLLVLLWTLTDHSVTYANENLFQVNPLSLALAVLLPVALLGSRFRPTAFRLALAAAVLAALGFLLQALPQLDQVNGEIIALVLPVHLAAAWLMRPHRAPPPLRKVDEHSISAARAA